MSTQAAQLAEALNRIAKLEAELVERDRQLEAVITDCDRDIVDLRKSFEVDSMRKSRSLSAGVCLELKPGKCPNCEKVADELKKYKEQWETISQHFHQVPQLLDSMITRTDKLINNITNSTSKIVG